MNNFYSYFVRVCPNSFVKSVLIEHFPFVILCIWCVQCVQATIKERPAAGATTALQPALTRCTHCQSQLTNYVSILCSSISTTGSQHCCTVWAAAEATVMTHHTNQTTGLTLFYKGVFSNFYNSPFTEKLSGVECKEWNNVEQYMHACKVGKT